MCKVPAFVRMLFDTSFPLALYAKLPHSEEQKCLFLSFYRSQGGIYGHSSCLHDVLRFIPVNLICNTTILRGKIF